MNLLNKKPRPMPNYTVEIEEMQTIVLLSFTFSLIANVLIWGYLRSGGRCGRRGAEPATAEVVMDTSNSADCKI